MTRARLALAAACTAALAVCWAVAGVISTAAPPDLGSSIVVEPPAETPPASVEYPDDVRVAPDRTASVLDLGPSSPVVPIATEAPATVPGHGHPRLPAEHEDDAGEEDDQDDDAEDDTEDDATEDDGLDG